MDSGTDTWVIVLAAFGGGLVGAILQPLLTYTFQRLRAGEERKKRSERTLRAMMTGWLQHGLELVGTAIITESLQRRGSPQTAEQIAALIGSGYDPGIWSGVRITDTELYDIGGRVHDLVWKLARLNWDPAIDAAKLDAMAKELKGLQERALKRMDALEWPEVED